MSETKVDREQLDIITVSRNVDKRPYTGVIVQEISDLVTLIREDNEIPEGMTDTDIMNKIGQAYQSGKHVHAAQLAVKADEFVDGMTIWYTHLVGLKRKSSKFGALAKYVDTAKSDLKAMGIDEPTDEQIRTVAAKLESDALERQAELKKLMGLS